MGKNEKLIEKILKGTSDANIDFIDLCNLLKSQTISSEAGKVNYD